MKNENKGMKEVKTMYTSEIDAQAKQGGDPANGQAVRSQLKRTNVTIGSAPSQAHVSEAQT